MLLLFKVCKSILHQIIVFPIVIVATYFLTLFANTSRILTSLFISKQTSLNYSWLHQAEGVFIYLSFLIIFYTLLNQSHGCQAQLQTIEVKYRCFPLLELPSRFTDWCVSQHLSLRSHNCWLGWPHDGDLETHTLPALWHTVYLPEHVTGKGHLLYLIPE